MEVLDNSKFQWETNGLVIHPRINLISIGKEEISIKPRLMDLLNFFLHHQNEIVTKDELLDEVWKDRIVTDNSLTKSISELRLILEKHFDSKIEIETLRNVGYRLHSISPFKKTFEQAKTKGKNKRNLKSLSLAATGVIALFITWMLSSDVKSKDDFNPSSQKSSIITSLNGTEISPALSPDGKKITFAWQNPEEDYFGIYVKSISESVPRKLTESSSSEFNPIWSEDGEKIIFFRRLPDGYQVLEKSILGQDENLLATIDSITVGRELVWNRPNNMFLFTGKRPGQNFSIFSLKITTKKVQQITSPPKDYYGDVYPSIGLKSNEVAFIRLREYQNILAQSEEPNKHLMVLNLETMKLDTFCEFNNDVKDLFTDRNNQSYLTWQSNRLGHNFLTSVDSRGNKRLVYETNSGVVGESTKVDSMLCFELWNSDLSISKCDLSFENQVSNTRRFLESSQWEWGLDVSNNNKMAFISNRTGSQQIWYGNTFDPFSVQQYSRFENVNIQSLDLSNNGDLIMALGIKNNSNSIFLVQSKEALMEEIVVQTTDINSPKFSSDNASIFYASNASGKWNIWQYDLSSGATKELIAYEAYDLILPHHDLDNIYYLTKDQRSIWTFNPATGQKVKIAQNQRFVPQNWYPSNKGVYFIKWKENSSFLAFYEYTSGQVRILKEYKGVMSTLPSITLSPDFKSIYITKSEKLNSDIRAIKV